MASEPGAGPQPTGPAPAPAGPRPPLGAWPRLYAVVLGVLALEIVLLKLLPSLLAGAGRP